MHPVGQSWTSSHHDFIGSLAACQACHGAGYRGTVLSRAQTVRKLTASFDTGSVTLNLFRGATVGCYNCHNGPFNSNANTGAAPVVGNISINTSNNQAVAMQLPATSAASTLKIISQPLNGAVGLSNGMATYFPPAGFTGTDTFTFAVYDGAKNSNLAPAPSQLLKGRSRSALSPTSRRRIPPPGPSRSLSCPR